MVERGMTSNDRLEIALGGLEEVPNDWMPAAAVRALVFGDPAIVWLEQKGADHGFEPERSDYDFIDFIAENARGFETKWVSEMAGAASRVCGTEKR